MKRESKNKVLNKNVKHGDVYHIDNIKNGNVSLIQNNTFYSNKGERMTASPMWEGMHMSSSSRINGRPSKTNIDRANERLNSQMRQLFETQRTNAEKTARKVKAIKRKRLLQKLTGRDIYNRIKAFAVTNRPQITYGNVKKYIKAELSKIEQGPVSLPIYEERKKICGECPHRKYVDGYKDPLGFCTKCGCGANPRAQLTVKLKLPATSCPLDKWGESTGIYEGFWGRIRYILSRNKKGQDNG